MSVLHITIILCCWNILERALTSCWHSHWLLFRQWTIKTNAYHLCTEVGKQVKIWFVWLIMIVSDLIWFLPLWTQIMTGATFGNQVPMIGLVVRYFSLTILPVTELYTCTRCALLDLPWLSLKMSYESKINKSESY